MAHLEYENEQAWEYHPWFGFRPRPTNPQNWRIYTKPAIVGLIGNLPKYNFRTRNTIRFQVLEHDFGIGKVTWQDELRPPQVFNCSRGYWRTWRSPGTSSRAANDEAMQAPKAPPEYAEVPAAAKDVGGARPTEIVESPDALVKDVTESAGPEYNTEAPVPMEEDLAEPPGLVVDPINDKGKAGPTSETGDVEATNEGFPLKPLHPPWQKSDDVQSFNASDDDADDDALSRSSASDADGEGASDAGGEGASDAGSDREDASNARVYEPREKSGSHWLPKGAVWLDDHLHGKRIRKDSKRVAKGKKGKGGNLPPPSSGHTLRKTAAKQCCDRRKPRFRSLFFDIFK